MLILFETTRLATFEMLLAGIPESVGLLAFGIVLVFVAVMIRRLLRRGDAQRTDEKISKKA